MFGSTIRKKMYWGKVLTIRTLKDNIAIAIGGIPTEMLVKLYQNLISWMDHMEPFALIYKKWLARNFIIFWGQEMNLVLECKKDSSKKKGRGGDQRT